MKFTLTLVLLWMLTFCTSCKQETTQPTPKPETPSEVVVVNPPLPEKPKGTDCTVTPTAVVLRTGKKNLPTSGPFIVESHYATKEEFFSSNKGLFPSKQTEKISEHLQASCELLKSKGLPCPAYKNSWEKVWTPSEHGLVGQGAIGDIRPTRWQELWQGNLLYSNLSKYGPKPGTKYLVKNLKNGKTIVASFGFEIGPPAKVGLGGLTVEAMHYLEAVNGNSLWIGELKDQSIDYGPVKCGADVTWFFPVPTLPFQPPWKWI